MGLFTPREEPVKGWATRRERPLRKPPPGQSQREILKAAGANACKKDTSATPRALNLVERPTTAPLPKSVVDGVAAPKTEAIAAPYHWRPVQVRQHEQKSEMSYTVGTYVNTLSMSVESKTFVGASSHLIRMVPNNFSAIQPLWCYLVGGSFVICRGVVVGTCPREHDPESGRNMRIARLPVHMRPRHVLQFAALSREAYGVDGHIAYSSHLVTLVITTDGWISGVSSRETEGAIDLSAIRFSIGGGISLVDEVSLHTCDVAGTRLVTLQGVLTERFFAVHSSKPLALLPESCRPPRELPFVVAGTSPGGFHLLMTRPSKGMGVGGDLMWRDSIWNHDQINLTGMMFEVAAEVVSISTLGTKWTGETLKVFVKDFQNFLIRKFGSIETAWTVAFDTDGSGSINFTEFGLGCKASGYVGNATRLWAALDEDRSGEISLEELNTGVPQMQMYMRSHLESGGGDHEDLEAFQRLSLIDLLRMGEEETKEVHHLEGVPESAPATHREHKAGSRYASV